MPDPRITSGVSGEVLDFALDMQARLDDNREKGGWGHCDPRWLLKRLREETKELELALVHQSREHMVGHEAADVANFAMMISDVWKAHGRSLHRRVEEDVDA